MASEDDTREPTGLEDCERLLEEAKSKVRSIQRQQGLKRQPAQSQAAWDAWRAKLNFAHEKTVGRIRHLKDLRREFLRSSRLTVGNNHHSRVLSEAFDGLNKVRDVVYALTEEVQQLSAENAALRARLAAFETQANYDPPTVAGHDFWRDETEREVMTHG